MVAIAAIAETSYAQSSPPTSKLFQEANFDAPPDENGGLQGGTGGATRSEEETSIVVTDSCTYAAIIPEHKFSTTGNSHPTFWLYAEPSQTEEEETFVQASLYLTPYLTEAEVFDSLQTKENMAPDLDANLTIAPDTLLENTANFDFPIVRVKDKLTEGSLISLKVPQYDEGLSDQETYLAVIEVACGASEELLEEDIDNVVLDINGSRSIDIVVSRNAEITTNFDTANYLQQQSWLDTVDAVARLYQETETPIDTTTAILIEEWNNLLVNLDTKIQDKKSL